MRTFAFLLGCVLTSMAAADATPARIEGPAVKVGDTWIYNRLDGWNNVLQDISLVRVKGVGAEGILMEASALDGSNIARIRRTPDFNLVRIEASRFTKTTLPYYPNFSFPLWVGKTWKAKVAFASTDQPGKSVRADLEARVVGFESVTVPAGTFFALKIELGGPYRASNLEGNWTGHIEDTLWYAPEARNAVRYEYKDTSGTSLYNHEIHELVRYWLVP
ncbi:MAG: hypothetical protein IPG33_10250 [Betaproteobacteria bacterium]|nr:hypothetical protein [Betaproteobacteria bacterium]